MESRLKLHFKTGESLEITSIVPLKLWVESFPNIIMIDSYKYIVQINIFNKFFPLITFRAFSPPLSDKKDTRDWLALGLW